jgi:S-adenosylmethionine hydrolase
VLGTEVEATSLTPALVPLPQEDEDGHIRGEVLWVDRYGNCQLNVAPEQLETAGARPGDAVEISFGDPAPNGERATRRARWVRAFADAKPSELVLLVDSYGMCALALDRRSAATELRVHAGSPIALATERGAPGTNAEPGVAVGLGRKEPQS